jgi:hypothetical protein
MIFITNVGSNFTANELRFIEGISFCRSEWSCSLVWSVSRTHKNASDWSVMILGCPHSFLNFMERTLGEKNIYYNNINFVYWRHVFDCLKLFKCRSYLWLWLCIPVCNDPERQTRTDDCPNINMLIRAGSLNTCTHNHSAYTK